MLLRIVIILQFCKLIVDRICSYRGGCKSVALPNIKYNQDEQQPMTWTAKKYPKISVSNLSPIVHSKSAVACIDITEQIHKNQANITSITKILVFIDDAR